MSYVNVGAEINGRPVATKKELRLFVSSFPDMVTFYTTSPLGPVTGCHVATELPTGFKYSVVGPDPFTKRVWYATVEHKADGTLKVS